MRPVRLLMCGGRDFADVAAVSRVIRSLPPGSTVIHGGARGADAIAGESASIHRLHVDSYPADWHRFGRGAGPIRNAEMLRRSAPTHYYAFPGGSGTADMVRRCIAAGVPRWSSEIAKAWRGDE